MQEQNKHRELAYSPIGMSLDKLVGKEAGWGTFLFTVSRSCHNSCSNCWTETTSETIEEQLRLGTDWLYNGRYGINVLDNMLQIFKEQEGKLVACMSDGEPFVKQNYDWTLKLAESCGRQDLPFLLFTSGDLFSKEKLKEIEETYRKENPAPENPAKTSYCISIQTGIRERYGLFTKRKNPDCELAKTQYDNFINNLSAWKEYDAKVLEKTGKHGIAIHTYIDPGHTEERDLEAVKQIVDKLGNVPWVVTPPGTSVLRSLEGESTEKSEKIDKLVQKYSTGPTATLTIGEIKICSYTAHGFYPLKKKHPFGKIKGVFGITFNPYYRTVQTCPYHSDISARRWLNLENYLNALQDSGITVSKKHVKEWLGYAIKAETIITERISDLFSKAGYEHCINRHSEKPSIDNFIKGINAKMAGNAKELDIKNPRCFDNLISALRETLYRERKPLIKYKQLAIAAAIIAALGIGYGVKEYSHSRKIEKERIADLDVLRKQLGLDDRIGKKPEPNELKGLTELLKKKYGPGP